MERIDEETGEVIEAIPHERPGKMPPSIAKAIVAVMAKCGQLGFDERNQHGGYNYASIDKFLAAVRPLCAEAGLVIMLDEHLVDFRTNETDGGKRSNWLDITYHFNLYAGEGDHFGPMTRRVIVPAVGAQAFGSAESYALKRFMRNLFQIPTGEKDADAEEGKPLPSSEKAQRRGADAAKPKEAAPKPQTANGASAASVSAREEAEAIYKSFRRSIELAPNRSALTSLVEEYTRDKRLATLRSFSEKHYDAVMNDVQKRLDVLVNQPKESKPFEEEIVA